jgi:hypothetical protein
MDSTPHHTHTDRRRDRRLVLTAISVDLAQSFRDPLPCSCSIDRLLCWELDACGLGSSTSKWRWRRRALSVSVSALSLAAVERKEEEEAHGTAGLIMPVRCSRPQNH